MPINKRRFAYRFYFITGLVMMALLLLDLASGGEVSLQLPMIIFMGIFVTGPVLLLVFVIPTVMSTAYVHQKPRDPLLLAWSWAHFLFWIFILDNVMFFADAFVVSIDTIYWVWGAYALAASSFPVLYLLIKNPWIRLLLVALWLAAVSAFIPFWDDQQRKFAIPGELSTPSLDLIKAAQAGDRERVEALIERGADIDARDENGWDSLYHAAWERHYELVGFLLENGADPNTRENRSGQKCFNTDCTRSLIISGSPVITRMIVSGNAYAVQLLLAHGAEEPPCCPLAFAAAAADPERLARLLESGQRPPRIAEAMRLAASLDQSEPLQILLEAGGSPDDGIRPATAWARAGNLSLLLEHGADPNATDWHGITPLMVRFENYPGTDDRDTGRVIQALIDAGADVNYVNDFILSEPSDNSVLMQAVKYGNTGLVKMLVEAGADANHQDGNGFSALMYARSTAIIEVLLSAGADVGIKNNSGQTALEYFRAIGEDDLARALDLPD